MVATGTVAVMAREIGLWSSGALQTRPDLTRPLDAAVARALAETPPALGGRISLGVPVRFH